MLRPSAAATDFSAQGQFTATGGKPRAIHLLSRGDLKAPGELMRPGTAPLWPGASVEFALPANLPHSFSGEFTRIVYLLEAKVDLPLHADIRHEQALHVLPAPLIDADQSVSASARSPPIAHC